MLVFCIRFEFDSNLDINERNALLDQWITEAIENNRLQFGGGGLSNVWEGVIENPTGGDASEKHRSLVEKWLQENIKVLDYQVGPLVEDGKLWAINQLILTSATS